MQVKGLAEQNRETSLKKEKSWEEENSIPQTSSPFWPQGPTVLIIGPLFKNKTGKNLITANPFKVQGSI